MGIFPNRKSGVVPASLLSVTWVTTTSRLERSPCPIQSPNWLLFGLLPMCIFGQSHHENAETLPPTISILPYPHTLISLRMLTEPKLIELNCKATAFAFPCHF
jgi:hypothetical protein